MIKLGITGVMGSGKSSVAEVLRGLGMPIYDCDSRAKELNNTILRNKIIEILGIESFYDNGTGEMNRAYIASKIFSSKELKNQIEGVVHPALDRDLEEWILNNKGAEIVGIESAILVGSFVENVIDKLLIVHCPEEELYERVSQRSGLTKEQIKARLDSQLSQEELLKRADFTLFTSINELLVPKVVALHKKLLSL